jgi:hypothetical protein
MFWMKDVHRAHACLAQERTKRVEQLFLPWLVAVVLVPVVLKSSSFHSSGHWCHQEFLENFFFE